MNDMETLLDDLVAAAHAVVPENPVYRSQQHHDSVRAAHRVRDEFQRMRCDLCKPGVPCHMHPYTR